MTLPVEHAALAGRRVARASLKPQNRRCLRELRQAKRRDGDTAACRRNEGQAQHVDYSSSCFLRLVPASAPRYLAPDALQGLAWETAGGAPSSSSCLGESGPARMLNAQRRNHERDTTRPAHRDAVSQTPERAAATALARRLPLATPSSIPCHDWQHPRPCAHASRSRAHSPESPRRGARPRFDQLRPLLENQLRNLLYIPTHPILPPRPTKGSNPLAACKTLASPAAAFVQIVGHTVSIISTRLLKATSLSSSTAPEAARSIFFELWRLYLVC